MKRLLIVLFAILLFACGCAQKVDAETVYQEAYNKGYTDGLASAQQPVEATSPTFPTETVLPTSVPEKNTEQQSIGSRKNPAKLNEPVEMNIDTYSGRGTLSITLIDVIFGEDAWNLILAENQFNEAPTEGKQYILAKFAVTFLQDISGEDKPLEVDKYYFDYSTSDYSVEANPSVVIPKPEFDLKLFEGASGEGYVAFLTSSDEASPMAVFFDTAWFLLK